MTDILPRVTLSYMARRKGTPQLDTAPEPAAPDTPKETEPPPPDNPEGKDKNPKLKETRGQIASGAPWDPKRSKQLAKQYPKKPLVDSWKPVGEAFATGTDVALMLFFGPDEVLTRTGVIPERTQVVEAWAARLAIEPPENIKSILNVNLILVYAFIFMPRIQRAYAKKLDENSPKCVATAVKQLMEKRNEHKEAKQAGKNPRAPGAEPQGAAGSEGSGPRGAGEGGAGGRAGEGRPGTN